MDEISGSFYLMSRHRQGNMILCSVEIDGIPDEGFLYRKLQSLVHFHPKLQYIPKENKGILRSTFHWKRGDFHIEDHFICMEKSRFDKRNYRRNINRLLKSPLAPDKPGWLCYYITYKKSNKSFLVWKCHHTYGDGFLISEYLKKFADASSIMYPKKIRPHVSLYKKIYSLIVTVISLLHFIFVYKKEKLPINKENSDEDPALFYHCKTWDLNEIRDLKNRYRVTVNDLLYTIIIKSLRKYCKKSINISSLSVFNLRDYSKEEDLVNVDPNNIGLMMVTEKIENENMEELLKRSHEKFSNYKSSPITYIITQILRYIYYISPWFAVKIIEFFGKKSTFGISNFRTFSEGNHINGCPVVNISSMVVPYGVGMLFTIVSYNDKITLNVTYRKRNLTSPKIFIKGLEDIYKELLENSKI